MGIGVLGLGYRLYRVLCIGFRVLGFGYGI